MTMKRTTDRKTMAKTRDKEGAGKNERLKQYNFFLTDSFGYRTPVGVEFYQNPGPPNQIDGQANNDQYRRSSWISRNTEVDSELVNTDLLRENSLARQLQTKEDQPAVIRVVRRKSPEELTDSIRKKPGEPFVPWENLMPPNTKFFLEQVSESREEKVQVIDTFGQWVAFFFGARPEVYNYSGTLLNAKNHNWKNDFQLSYDRHLRGSQAVKNRATVFMQYDDVIVEGYILNVQMQMTSMSNHSVPFSFSMLIINRTSADPERMLLTRFDLGAEQIDSGDLLTSLQARIGSRQDNTVEDLTTYLIVREYFAGSFLPMSGVASVKGTNETDSGTQVQPKQVGGILNPATDFAGFSPAITDALESAFGTAGE